MTCVYAGGRLAAYLNNELSVDHPIAIDSNFTECPACADVVREGRELSEVVKSAGDGLLDSELVEQVRASGEMVLSRVSAEQEVARTTGIRRLVENVSFCGWPVRPVSRRLSAHCLRPRWSVLTAAVQCQAEGISPSIERLRLGRFPETPWLTHSRGPRTSHSVRSP